MTTIPDESKWLASELRGIKDILESLRADGLRRETRLSDIETVVARMDAQYQMLRQEVDKHDVEITSISKRFNIMTAINSILTALLGAVLTALGLRGP